MEKYHAQNMIRPEFLTTFRTLLRALAYAKKQSAAGHIYCIWTSEMKDTVAIAYNGRLFLWEGLEREAIQG